MAKVENSTDLLTQMMTQDILKRSGSQPIYLSKVEVNGGETFTSDFFQKLLSPLVEKSDYTLAQLIDTISVSQDKLVKTNVFRSIDVTLHSDYSALFPKQAINYNKEKPLSTKVIFDLLTINLNIGEGFLNVNSEDNMNVKLNYLNNNFNENAELVNIGVDYNPYKPNDHLITNAQFLASLNNPSYKFIIDLFHSQQNNKSWQQASEGATGGLIGLQYNKSNYLNMLTGLSLAKRTIHDVDDAAADELKFFAGDYLKSSIVNQIIFSKVGYLNQLTKNFPVNGVNIAISNEISSNQEQENPQNQASFIKSSASLNYFHSFFNNNITTSFSGDFGGIYTTTPNSQVHISDRFYLGGYSSFKGFTRNALNTNGGLQFYKVNGTVYAKLPSFIYHPYKTGSTNQLSLEDGLGFEANPLRLYVSGTVGNLSNNLLADKNQAASSIGLGLKYFNHWANFDIGYFVARRHGEVSAQGIKNGLQFSLSVGGSNRSLSN